MDDLCRDSRRPHGLSDAFPGDVQGGADHFPCGQNAVCSGGYVCVKSAPKRCCAKVVDYVAAPYN